MNMFHKFRAWLKEDAPAPSRIFDCDICCDIGFDYSGLRCACSPGPNTASQVDPSMGLPPRPASK